MRKNIYTAKTNAEQIFPEKEYRGLSPNFHIHVSVSELYIPTMGLPFLLEEICGLMLGIYKSLTDIWMWKLGLRPRNSQKRNINGIVIAVYRTYNTQHMLHKRYDLFGFDSEILHDIVLFFLHVAWAKITPVIHSPWPISTVHLCFRYLFPCLPSCQVT